MRHSSSSPNAASLPIGTVVTVGPRTGILVAYRPANMVDVRFEQTLNGAARSVVERCSAASVQPAARENPAKGLKRLIRAWAKTPQARARLPVLRGVVLNADLTADTERQIPADFFPEKLIDTATVQLVIGRDGTTVLLASDSPRRGAKAVREALTSGRVIRLTGPQGGLSEGQRATLPPSAFAVKRGGKMSWPIHDQRHAEIALNYMKRGFGNREDYPAILSQIQKRYPNLVPTSPTPVSNPAGQDFQDPEKIQFRRVVAGITRSLVRKELGLPASPRSKEMTAADLRREEALFLSLSPEHRRSITSTAYAIATRQGQKHGWLKAGTQQPTAKAAARSEERMLFDPLEAQKDRFYEVMLAGQRKSGFYRVVPREVAVGRGVQTRYYIEPADDPKHPQYFLTQAKAEDRKNAMNAAVSRHRRPALRNPGPKVEPDVDLDFDVFADFSPSGDVGAGTQTPSERAARPSGTEGSVGASLDIDDQMSDDLDFVFEDESIKASPQGMAFVDNILTNMATPRNTDTDLMNDQNPRPFYDIVRKRLVDNPNAPTRSDGSPAKMYVIPDVQSPFDPETDKIFFEVYLPRKVQYVTSSQRGAGGNTILVPAQFYRTDLQTRSRGRGAERREETVLQPYSQVGRGESSVINANQAIIDRFLSPYGSVSQKWERYRAAKNDTRLRGRARFSRLRGLIPRPGEHLIPAKRNDPVIQAGRGTYNPETNTFENKVFILYRKWYTTNADIFRFIVEYYRSPGLPTIMNRLDTLVQDAKRAAESSAPQIEREDTEKGEQDILFEFDLNLDAPINTGSTIPQGLKKLDYVPSVQEATYGLQELKKYFTSRTQAGLKDLVLTDQPGVYSIPGFGPSRVVFSTAQDAIDWLTRGAGGSVPFIQELHDLYQAYLNASSARYPISPVTVSGTPFSAGPAAIQGLRRSFEEGLVEAVAVGEQEKKRAKTLGAAQRTTQRALDRERRRAQEEARPAQEKAQQASAQAALRSLSSLSDDDF